MSAAANGSGSKSKSVAELSPEELHKMLDRQARINPTKLIEKLFSDGDSHLAAIARTRYDDATVINSLAKVLLDKIIWWDEDQFYNYLTFPINNPLSPYYGHCIISLAAMNPNKFLDILLKKIQESNVMDNAGFNAYPVVEKLTKYRVPHGICNGESLYTLAIKYGDVARNYYKLIAAYKQQHISGIDGGGQILHQSISSYEQATDCMERTPLEIARASYFDTVKTYSYYSHQANITFNMIYHLTPGKSVDTVKNELERALKERGIYLGARRSKKEKKSDVLATSSSQVSEEKSSAAKRIDKDKRKKRKRGEDAASEATESVASDQASVEKDSPFKKPNKKIKDESIVAAAKDKDKNAEAKGNGKDGVGEDSVCYVPGEEGAFDGFSVVEISSPLVRADADRPLRTATSSLPSRGTASASGSSSNPCSSLSVDVEASPISATSSMAATRTQLTSASSSDKVAALTLILTPAIAASASCALASGPNAANLRKKSL